MSEPSLDRRPLLIRMHDQDNVAVVANDGGLPAGTTPPGGPCFVDKVPQGHKVALADIPAGAPVRRYGVPIGYAKQDIAAGRWVHEKLLDMPAGRGDKHADRFLRFLSQRDEALAGDACERVIDFTENQHEA